MRPVASVLGRAGFPLTGGYCASKFALEGLGEALYYELRPLGVRVGIVEPGGRRTNFGDNVEWAEGASDTYREVTAAYRGLLDKVRGRRGKRSAESVVDALVRLAEARRVPLRTRVGGDAAPPCHCVAPPPWPRGEKNAGEPGVLRPSPRPPRSPRRSSTPPAST